MWERRGWLVATVVVLCGLVNLGFGDVAVAASPGIVSAWGYNGYGQLGNGSTTSTSIDTPGAVSGLSGVTAIAAGNHHSLALLSNGTVLAWGSNTNGQLGNGTISSTGCACVDTPAIVSGLTGVTAIAAGTDYSLALLSNGTVMAWGYNGYGQLGNGTTADSSRPALVGGLSGVRAIAAGDRDSLAVLSDGTVRAWGYNGDGQLGDGLDTGPDMCGGLACSKSPVTVTGLSGVKAVAAGFFSLALQSNGKVMAWGYGIYGQLGDGTATTSEVPVPVSGITSATAIAAGDEHGLALLSNGTVMAWGYNPDGQLGDGTSSGPAKCGIYPCSQTPVAVSGLTGVTAITAGEYHSVALLSNGTVMAWGDNIDGELGNGTTSSSGCFCIDTPVAVTGLTGVTALGSGDEAVHTLALQGSFGALSPASLAFGRQLVGSASASQSVTVRNAGPAPLTVSGATLTGTGAGAFHKISDACSGVTLAVGATCKVSVSFLPGVVGPAAATLAVQSTSAVALASVALTGTGIAATTIVRAKFDNQQITLTTPSLMTCTARTKTLSVKLTSTAIAHSHARKVIFSRAAFFIGKGVKHTRKKTVRLKNGKHETITVTTYTANAAAHHVPATTSVKLTSLKSGSSQTLKIVVSYKETVTKHRHKKIVIVSKTLTAKFKVC